MKKTFSLAITLVLATQFLFAQNLDTILTAPGGLFDCFGCSLSAFENTLIIGAPVANSGAGKVHVYTKTNAGWTKDTVLISTDSNAGDQFGSSVSIYEHTIIVGAKGDDESGNNLGAAYIFKKVNDVWVFVDKIMSGLGPTIWEDAFGTSVSVYGEYAVIGAHRAPNPPFLSGGAYLFKDTGSAWEEIQKLSSPTPTSNSGFGTSVSIFGDYTVVGAPRENYFGGGHFEGAVHIYRKNSGVWSFEKTLLPSTNDQENRLGIAVSIEGNRIIAGASFNQETAPNSGAAFIYEKQDTDWVLQAKIKAGDAELNDFFGGSVSIKDGLALVSSEDNTTGTLTGATYVIKKEGQDWKEKSKLTGGENSDNFRFGSSTAIGEGFFAISAPEAPGSSGLVYIYNLESQPVRHFHRLENGLPVFQSWKQINAANGEDQVSFKVCADSAEASVFSISKTGQLTGNLILRIKEDTLGAIPEQFGLLAFISSNEDSLVYSYQHPDFIPDTSVLSAEYHLQIFNPVSQNVVLEIPLQVHRAPVVLVHGLWSEGVVFENMRDTLIAAGLYRKNQFYLSDYKATNDEAFQANNWVVPSSITILLNQLADAGIAAGKVDVVGHSMGGTLGRLYLQSDQYHHDLHKLITLNTPHSGTQAANWLLERVSGLGTAICYLQKSLYHQSCSDGAVQDLAVNSNVTLSDLNGPGKLNKNVVPSHVIATTMPIVQQISHAAEIFNGIMTVVDVVDNNFHIIPYPWKQVLDITGSVAAFTVDFQKFLDTLYNFEPHDLIVPLSSQLGGLGSTQSSLEINQPHIGSTGNEFVINYVRALLKARTDTPVFSADGFHPHTLQPSIFSFQSPSQARLLSEASQDSLFVHISSFVEGQTILPGQTFSIHVSGSPQITNLVLLISHTAGKVYRGEREGAAGDFTFTADSSIFGTRRILAAGYDSLTDQIVFDTSTIVILPNGAPDSIWVNPDALTIVQGKQAAFRIMASFADATSEITNIPGIQYHFTSGNAHLTGNGFIYGDSIGMDTMEIAYMNHSNLLSITIIENIFEPGCPDVGQPCDDGDPETVNDSIQVDCTCAGTSGSNPLSQVCPSDIIIVLPMGVTEAAVNWNPPTATTVCGSDAEYPCQREDIPGFRFLGIFNGSAYFVSNDLKTWTNAKADCESQGGHLATVTSQEENDFIVHLLDTEEAAYIGISDVAQEDNFIWVTGEPASYFNWENGEPDNGPAGDEHYVVLHPWSKRWSDYDYWVAKKYILEKECADGDLETIQTTGIQSGDTLSSGQYEVAFSSTDSCGNQNECDFSIVVAPAGDTTYCDGLVNFALNATVTQSSTYNSFSGADKAIDANTSGRMWPDSSVAQTIYESHPWFNMDLGEDKKIRQINFWPRTDCCGEHFSNFYMVISKMPFNDTNLDSILSQPDVRVFFQKQQIARPSIWAVGTSGRYIRIQIDKEAFLALAELEVLGCEQISNRQADLTFSALKPDPDFNLFPNPATEKTSLIFSQRIAEVAQAELILIDLFGREIRRIHLSQEDLRQPFNLDLSGFRSGYYFLWLEPQGIRRIAMPIVIARG